jgi:hypothetical protein
VTAAMFSVMLTIIPRTLYRHGDENERKDP